MEQDIELNDIISEYLEGYIKTKYTKDTEVYDIINSIYSRVHKKYIDSLDKGLAMMLITSKVKERVSNLSERDIRIINERIQN